MLIQSGTKQGTVFMSESVNHALDRYVRNTDSFGKMSTLPCVARGSVELDAAFALLKLY